MRHSLFCADVVVIVLLLPVLFYFLIYLFDCYIEETGTNRDILSCRTCEGLYSEWHSDRGKVICCLNYLLLGN